MKYHLGMMMVKKKSVEPADMMLFVVVVEEKGFTTAGRRLGMTKQWISERISCLEESLGVRLLERTTRHVRTTDAGREYFERCYEIREQIVRANRQVTDQQDEPIGHIRISVPVIYCRNLIMPAVAHFIARYPRVSFDVDATNRYVNLVEENFDLAIRAGKLEDSSLTAIRLGTGKALFVASPAYLEKFGEPQASNLASIKCISVKAHQVWQIDGVIHKLAPVLLVNDIEAAVAAALEGVGIAQVPDFLCKEAIESGRLRTIFNGQNSAQLPISIVYPSKRHLPARVKTFIQVLVKYYEEAQRPN